MCRFVALVARISRCPLAPSSLLLLSRLQSRLSYPSTTHREVRQTNLHVQGRRAILEAYESTDGLVPGRQRTAVPSSTRLTEAVRDREHSPQLAATHFHRC